MSITEHPERLSRFGDWSPIRQLCVSGPGAGGRPFYAGDEVHARMALVRRAIEDIRVNWERYSAYMTGLRALMQPGVDADGGIDLQRRVAQLFESNKEWIDTRPDDASEEYSAVRLYTSADGYNQMFSAINRAFRNDGLVDDASALQSAVFLVELLNIDLFNYCARQRSAPDYEGRIFRGMVVTPRELDRFSTAATEAVEDRYVAIPLGMASASTDRATALEFVAQQARCSANGQPLLWDIEVVGLPADRLEVYRALFPTSVVSTICAVPIQRLSDFPEENEILLRGPFFQIVRLRRSEEPVGGKPLNVVEAIMLTANRDHPSTMRLTGWEATAARDLFRTLVAAHRCQRCADRAAANDDSQDEAAFSRLASDREREIDKLLHAIEQRRR